MKQLNLGIRKKLVHVTAPTFTIVDDDDYEWLAQWKWHAVKSSIHNKTWYAARREKINGARKIIYMHRIIMEAKPDQSVDHKDRNGLNNQRLNLRFATAAENAMNRDLQNNNTTGYIGVLYNKRNKYRPWTAHITVDQQSIIIGYFDNVESAVEARDEAALRYFGEFATLNRNEIRSRSCNA